MTESGREERRKILTTLAPTAPNIIDGPSLPSISGFVKRRFITRLRDKDEGEPQARPQGQVEGNRHVAVYIERRGRGEREKGRGKIVNEISRSRTLLKPRIPPVSIFRRCSSTPMVSIRALRTSPVLLRSHVVRNSDRETWVFTYLA